MRLSLVVTILGFVAQVIAGPAIKGDTLVISDTKGSSQYSRFIDSLDLGEVTVLPVGDESISLFRNGVRLYQNLVILPTKARVISPHVAAKELVEFVNDGGSVLGVTGSSAQLELEKFLQEVGIYTNNKFKLVDHFNAGTDGSVVIEAPKFENGVVVRSKLDKLHYSGSAALLSNSEYLIPILRAPKTSYSYNEAIGPVGADSVWTSGDQGYLIVSFQARNNARVTWIGDDNILVDDQYSQLADDLASWTFQKHGVIRAVSTSHRNVATGEQAYKIKDLAEYQIALSQWSSEQDCWVPFVTDDVQVEFIMLDPYQRVGVHPVGSDANTTLYSAVIPVPDQHGMFTFQVDYKRPGLSFVEEKTVVPVRHLANDEYPRSWEITNSWVYLTSSVSVVAAWFVFVVVFVLSGKKPLGDKKDA